MAGDTHELRQSRSFAGWPVAALILATSLGVHAIHFGDHTAALTLQSDRHGTDIAGTAAPEQRGPTDAVELGAFLDGVMARGLAGHEIAGAAIAVVKDGALLFARGYGYRDVAQHLRVDPERTLFRLGSLTKLFTATAVMQLVDAGKLDLDADVQRYLGFTLPLIFSPPVTLRHILTHTTGFEDDGRDLWSVDATDFVAPDRWLIEHFPRQVRPPGTYASYSNHAFALAAHVVERTAGVPWETYIEREILGPLGMRRSSVRQPVPEPIGGEMSLGYRVSEGIFDPRPWEFMTSGGARAAVMSASATDMATFMLAHVGKGAVGGSRILSEASAEAMQRRAFGHDDRLPGLTAGFSERLSHGLRIIGHGGDTQWFHSDLALIPSENVGVFVTFNTNTGVALSTGALLQMFLDHYYPFDPPSVPRPAADARLQARRVAGEYQFNRMSYTTFQRAAGLLSASAVFTAQPDGSLHVRSVFGDRKIVPVGPLLYRDELGTELFAFKVDESGNVTHGFVGSYPTMALERKPWHQSLAIHWMVIVSSLLTFAWTLCAAVARGVRRRWATAPARHRLPGGGVLVAVAGSSLAFVLALAVLLSNPIAALSGKTTALRLVLAMPAVVMMLTCVAAAIAVRNWRHGTSTRAARVRYTAFVFCAALFVWSLLEWNLMFWYV